MEQCADLANDKLSAEVSSSGHNQGMMTHLETGFDFRDIHELKSVTYVMMILKRVTILQVGSLHDSVTALREKLEQCQQIRAELVTAR